MKKMLIAMLSVLLVSCCTFNFNIDSKSNAYDPHDALFSVARVSVDTKDGQGTLSGSAWAVDDNHLITAGHVCDGIVGLQVQGVLSDDIQLTYYKDHNFTTAVLHNAVIDAIDSKNDICVLGYDNHGLKPFQFSKQGPRVTDVVYIVGAPHGVFAAVAPGEVMSLDETFGPEMPNKIVVTAPAAPGNSGSVIVNDKGEVIGMLVAGAGEFDHLSIATSLEKIVKFYYENKDK